MNTYKCNSLTLLHFNGLKNPEEVRVPVLGMAVQFLRTPIHRLPSHFIRQVSAVVLQPNIAVSPLRFIQWGAPLCPDEVRSAHPVTENTPICHLFPDSGWTCRFSIIAISVNTTISCNSELSWRRDATRRTVLFRKNLTHKKPTKVYTSVYILCRTFWLFSVSTLRGIK